MRLVAADSHPVDGAFIDTLNRRVVTDNGLMATMTDAATAVR
jgi:hypothetical protein